MRFDLYFFISLHTNGCDFARYRRKVELYNGRVEELNAVTQERDDIKKQYDELRKRRHEETFIIPVLYSSFESTKLILNSAFYKILVSGWMNLWRDLTQYR